MIGFEDFEAPPVGVLGNIDNAILGPAEVRPTAGGVDCDCKAAIVVPAWSETGNFGSEE